MGTSDYGWLKTIVDEKKSNYNIDIKTNVNIAYTPVDGIIDIFVKQSY